MIEARKITFQEAWDSSVFFFIDEELEQEIDAQAEALLEVAGDHRVSETAAINADNIADFLIQKANSLDVILKDIDLSQEKSMRVISLLRNLGKIPGGFETEWSVKRIKSKISREQEFAQMIADLLVDGKRDQTLEQYIPRYYLEKLDYRGIKGMSEAARRIRYKSSLIGTYGGRKGYKVEGRIKEKLADIESRYGISYTSGRSRFIGRNIDFAIPALEDPWIIVMSSFQETTSSGQTTKATDMREAYDAVQHMNSRYRENRAFVNFVDGGGWLARKRDLERLVDQCHYFINLRHLDMLEAIVLDHVPSRYFTDRPS